MNDNNPPANWADRAVGLGAGLASALLFAASTRGSSLAMALAYFSPLPLLIGALGFSLLGALLGSLCSARLCWPFRRMPCSVSAFSWRLRRSRPDRRRPAVDAFPVQRGEPSSPLPRFVSARRAARGDDARWPSPSPGLGVAVLVPALSRLRRRLDSRADAFQAPTRRSRRKPEENFGRASRPTRSSA